MAEHISSAVLDEKFEFSASAKKKWIISLLIGLGLLAIGCVLLATMGSGHHDGHGEAVEHVAEAASGHHEFHWYQRLYSNLWLNSVYFTGIALIGVFFFVIQYVAYAGWSAPLLRVPLAFGNYLPIAGIIMLAVFAVSNHDIFHWTHHSLYEKVLEDGSVNPEYDEIIDGKKGYLNMPFYLTRMVLYFVLWIGMFMVIKKISYAEDLDKSDKYWHKMTVIGPIFLIIFGITSSTSAWDWVLSIDTHWFSTMFGWYVFASWWVAGLAAITLAVVTLKDMGYLSIVREDHLHDLGKFMFAFSIFWTYIWFAQFMLIFYANIPEETTYFLDRMKNFDGMFYPYFILNLIINFAFPFLTLMTREAKRKAIFLKIVAIAILIGHWLDFYMMIMPGTLRNNSGFGLIEIGATMTFLSLFVLVVANSLTKGNLIPKNHPMMDEALHHHI